MIENVKIKEYKIFMDDYEGLCLSLVYQYEATDGLHELYIPKIQLDIYRNAMPSIDRHIDAMYIHNPSEDVVIDFGHHEFLGLITDVIVPNKFGEKHKVKAAVVDCLVKENVVEMTLNDIEKKLGHKIKIVNKED